MDKFALSATVNYPETAADTPDYSGLSQMQVISLVSRLLIAEKDALSFVITIAREASNAR